MNEEVKVTMPMEHYTKIQNNARKEGFMNGLRMGRNATLFSLYEVLLGNAPADSVVITSEDPKGEAEIEKVRAMLSAIAHSLEVSAKSH